MQIAAEAILFASGEPVHISRLCMALDTDRPRAEEALPLPFAAGSGRSTTVFHAPQAGQRPAHFGVSLPHSVQ